MSEHLLALLGTGPSGRFTHDAWTLDTDGGAGDPPMVLASFHEAHHAALNASTAWGAVLQAVALAGRFGVADNHVTESLVDLVGAARRTHEAYATHASVMDVVRAGIESDPAEALAAYPSYRPYLEQAIELGPPCAFENAWRQVAVESALQACMQSPAMDVLLARGLDRFTLASVRERDHPDRRLAALATCTPPWWHEAEQIAATALDDRWNLLSVLDVRASVTRRRELSGTWIELRRLCLDAALRALRRAGHQSLSTAEVRARLPGLIAEVARVSGPDAPPLILDTDASSGAFGLFEMESVRTGPRRVAHVRGLAGATVASLLWGLESDRHAYIVVRRRRHLDQRFALLPDVDLPTGDQPVVAVLSSDPDPGSVGLTVIPDPEALRDLAGRLGVPLLSSTSLDCSRDDDWLGRWEADLLRLTTPTSLLDLPVTQCLDAFVRRGEPFTYTVATDVSTTCVFVCRLGDDPPVLLPCATTAGQAFIEYVHSISGRRPDPEAAVLGEDSDAVRIIVGHLVSDERVIGNSGAFTP